jgi:hypothetical protein
MVTIVCTSVCGKRKKAYMLEKLGNRFIVVKTVDMTHRGSSPQENEAVTERMPDDPVMKEARVGRG